MLMVFIDFEEIFAHYTEVFVDNLEQILFSVYLHVFVMKLMFIVC